MRRTTSGEGRMWGYCSGRWGLGVGMKQLCFISSILGPFGQGVSSSTVAELPGAHDKESPLPSGQ